MHTLGKSPASGSSSLTKLEIHGQISGPETLEGLLQATKSLNCFVYNVSTEFNEDRTKDFNFGDLEFVSVLSKHAIVSLKRLKTNVFLPVENLSPFQRLTHLDAPLNTPPFLQPPGAPGTGQGLPSSLEHLILPGDNYDDKKLVRLVVNAKRTHWPHLRNLTLK